VFLFATKDHGRKMATPFWSFVFGPSSQIRGQP
jgi:hypothetical protein